MRLRLLRSTLIIALLAVVTLGLPLTILARHEVFSSAQDRLDAQAAAAAASLEDRLDAGEVISVARLQQLADGHRIVLRLADGRTLVSGPALTVRTETTSVEVSGATLTVQAPRHPTSKRADELTLVVAGLSGLAVIAAIGLALWQSRRLSAPLAALAERADRLGRQDFSAAPLASGIPEIDAISHDLARSAAQIGTLVGLQRDFATDAAHQLRTPLTGIGLRLEEIATVGRGAVRREAEDALQQVERLDRVISTLLARARGDSKPPEHLDLRELVTEEASAWERLLGAEDRRLAVQAPAGPVRVLCRRGHVSSILTSLLDNALQHGGGDVRVAVSTTGADALVTVRDEGPGVPAALVDSLFERSVSGSQGTGIGLALAHSLALAEDGSLTLSETSRSELQLRLPLA